MLQAAATGTRTARACPGPESCRKIRKPTLSIQHFRGSLFSRKKEASARPARCPVSSLVARGYGAVLILLCVNILCRRSGGQSLCRANTHQPRGRAVRRGLGKSSSRKPSPAPTDALKRLMHDDAAGIYCQDTRSNHREESSEPSAASHVTSAAPPSSDAAMRPLRETRALSAEPSPIVSAAHVCDAFHS